MNFHRSTARAILSGIIALSLGATYADEPKGVLKKMKESGVVTLGYRESSIPFSYLDDKTQPIGYSMEICGRIVDEIRSAIELPSLRVKLQPVTSANRIALVQNGTIDLECGSTINNRERQPLVGFSNTTFVVSQRFIADKSKNYKTLEDLKGKTVVVTTGTTTVRNLRELDRTHRLGLNVLSGKDHQDSFLLVTSGRAEAFFEDDILLVGMAASSPTPDAFALSTERYSADPYALVFAKGDADFKKLVDGVITGLASSGELEKMYDRWFVQPIPPKNIALNFPMSAAMKRVIANPTDSPDTEQYK